jgi:hypothetical protein
MVCPLILRCGVLRFHPWKITPRLAVSKLAARVNSYVEW